MRGFVLLLLSLSMSLFYVINLLINTLSALPGCAGWRAIGGLVGWLVGGRVGWRAS